MAKDKRTEDCFQGVERFYLTRSAKSNNFVGHCLTLALSVAGRLNTREPFFC